MATRLKDVDAVMVGMGWTGSIMARELTKAGLTVVGLERGEDLTPREFFAAGVVATNAWTRKTYGKDFDRLTAKEREAALKDMEAGKATFDDFNSKQFFEALLKIVMEGFFADPIYGGNRNKAGWRMVGYPGLPAVYSTLIDEYRNKRYVVEPQSIADFS